VLLLSVSLSSLLLSLSILLLYILLLGAKAFNGCPFTCINWDSSIISTGAIGTDALPTTDSCPTPSPTTAPTTAPSPPTGSSLTPVQLSVLQTLYGITAAQFDAMAQSVFKTAVAKVLSSYGVKSSDVTITSYSNGRRMLHDENQSRILAGQLQVSYIINFIAQSGGYASSSSAAAAATSTLTAAVQSTTFNNALSAAALSAGVSLTITSSSTITVTDTSPSSSDSKPSIDEGAAIGGAIGGFFGVVLVVLTVVLTYKYVYSKYPWEGKSVKGTEKSGTFTAVSQNANADNREDVRVVTHSVNGHSTQV